jgi:thiol-disulfide isomerase/thioredoxin
MIMKKTIGILSAVLFIGASLNGCRSTETVLDRTEKPFLEISFSGRTEEASQSYLSTVIGSGSGVDETFGEQKNLIVFYNEHDCFTCEKIRPVVEQWVKENGCTIYSYSNDTADGSSVEKKRMLEKLGSDDGTMLTAGRLVAFVKGKRIDSVSGTYDIATTEKITRFVSRYYTIPRISSRTVQELAGLDGLAALRRAVAYDGNFILYMERQSCPDCRMLSDPSRSDIITKLCNSYTGKLYRIQTEQTVQELEKPVVVDGAQYESAFEYLDKTGISALLWPERSETEKKRAELLELLTVQRFIPAFPDDDEAFFKGIQSYAQGKGDKFVWYDRFVPSFAAAGYAAAEARRNMDASAVLMQAYTLSEDTEAAGDIRTAHRFLFPAYFACDNKKIDTEQYYRLLTAWITSWK